MERKEGLKGEKTRCREKKRGRKEKRGIEERTARFEMEPRSWREE